VWRLPLVATLGLALSGCTTSVRSASSEAARTATPQVFDSTLDTLENPREAERLAGVLATPAVQSAIRDLASGLARGGLDGLSDEASQQRVEMLAGTVGRAAARAFVEEASSEDSRAKLQSLGSALSVSILRSAGRELPETLSPTLESALRDHLGPAIRDAMREDVAPALAGVVRTPDVQDALGDTVHKLARQAVLGSDEGIAELERRKRAGRSPIGTLFAERTWLVVILSVAVLLTLPLALLWRERVHAKRFRAEAERRDARAAALLGAMESASEGAPMSQILQMLRQQLFAETSTREPMRPGKAPPPASPRT
jgi:hypothetical protein